MEELELAPTMVEHSEVADHFPRREGQQGTEHYYVNRESATATAPPEMGVEELQGPGTPAHGGPPKAVVAPTAADAASTAASTDVARLQMAGATPAVAKATTLSGMTAQMTGQTTLTHF